MDGQIYVNRGLEAGKNFNPYLSSAEGLNTYVTDVCVTDSGFGKPVFQPPKRACNSLTITIVDQNTPPTFKKRIVEVSKTLQRELSLAVQ